MTFVAVIVIFAVIRIIFHKKKESKYIEAFDTTYKECGVYKSLSKAKDEYKPSSLEYMAIDKGMHYLNHSILMDYKTCFSIIENVFNSKTVKEMHKKILEEEVSKCKLLLEKKEE